MKSPRSAFTLIELLVVIAIIAVLSVVVVLSLNPSELLRQSRDTNRLSDMDTLNHALSVYSVDQSGMPSFFMGSSSIVYVSLPDSSSTCGNLSLPILPTGSTYACVASTTLKNTNGSGWIPVPLSSTSGGSPVGNLPIDPTNQSSTRLYYTYTTNGTQYEITSAMESAKYKLGGPSDQISGDGGTLATVYEKGSKLGLEPLDYGDSSLVGLWTFDEGTGTKTYDYSGSNDTGSFGCLGTSCSGPSWAAGKIGSSAIYTNPGTSQTSYSSAPASPVNIPSVSGSAISISLWINPSVSEANNGQFLRNGNGSDENYGFYLGQPSGGNYKIGMEGYSGGTWRSANTTSYIVPASIWSHLVLIFTQGQGLQVYINGLFQQTVSFPYITVQATTLLGMGGNSGSYAGLNGSIDDVRIYNRALSSAEIAALYAGGK